MQLSLSNHSASIGKDGTPITSFAMKEGDTEAIPLDLTDKDGNPLDITGHTGKITITSEPGGRALVRDAPINILTPATGKAEYRWTDSNQTKGKAGEYFCEVILTNTTTGKERTIPGGKYGQVFILPRL